jgi:hypothetical protein
VISQHNHNRPSVGQVATIGNHRHLAHREVGNLGNMMLKHFEFAIRETPMSGGQLSSQQRRRTEAKWRPAVSQPGDRDIEVFEGKESEQQEIAIRDFPTRSKPFISRTRGSHLVPLVKAPQEGFIGHREIASPGDMCFASSPMPKPRWEVIRLRSYRNRS